MLYSLILIHFIFYWLKYILVNKSNILALQRVQNINN